MGKTTKKCKGVKKNVVKKRITHEDFLNCLFTNKEQMRKMYIIRSRFHNIFTETVNKVSLSADDDKESSWKTKYQPWQSDIIELKNLIRLNMIKDD